MSSHTTLLVGSEHDAIPKFQGLDLVNKRIIFVDNALMFFGGEALKVLLCTDKLYLTSIAISFTSMAWLLQKENVV